MSPFPYLPMVAIMATLVTDMSVQMSVVSYAGFMVEHLGVVDDKDKTGYYAGMLSTAFMIGRLVTSHFWGLVCDRHGCRSVMAFGLCATVVLALGFGCSPAFAWAVGLRFLFGLITGTMVAGKAIVSSVCGEEHDTVGMGVVTAAFSLGQVIGPGVGGMLSEPSTRHPGTFSESGIFGSTCAWIWSWCKRGGGDNKETNNDDDGSKEDSATPTKPGSALPIEADGGTRVPSWMETDIVPAVAIQNGSGYDAKSLRHEARDPKPKSLLFQEHIRVLLFIDALYAVTYSGLEAVFTLWALSSIANGGLNWSVLEIGQVFSACGLVLLVFELVFVPIITPLWGIRFCQRLGSVVEVPIYLVIPLLAHMSTTGIPVRIAAVTLLFTFLACTDPFYIGVSLALNNATGPDRRGEMNGIYMTTTSLSRAISPVFFSTLFAFSIDGDRPFPFDYHLAFYFLALIRLTVACMGWNRICDNGAVGRKRMIFGE